MSVVASDLVSHLFRLQLLHMLGVTLWFTGLYMSSEAIQASVSHHLDLISAEIPSASLVQSI